MFHSLLSYFLLIINERVRISTKKSFVRTRNRFVVSIKKILSIVIYFEIIQAVKLKLTFDLLTTSFLNMTLYISRDLIQ